MLGSEQGPAMKGSQRGNARKLDQQLRARKPQSRTQVPRKAAAWRQGGPEAHCQASPGWVPGTAGSCRAESRVAWLGGYRQNAGRGRGPLPGMSSLVKVSPAASLLISSTCNMHG